MKVKATSQTAWQKWRVEALGRFRLDDVYGDILTDRKQGKGWLEARDPRSKTGDRNPSAGVSDGEGDCERGRFKSFIDDCNMSVFDYLVEVKGHDLDKTYEIIAESSGVPLPAKSETNGETSSNGQQTEANRTANGQAASAVSSGFKANWIDSPTFAAADYRPHMLVQNLLVANQPGIVGGPRKTLKTTLLIELAVSLGSGTHLLGRFKVYKKVRTLVLSGESGEYTLQETAARICLAREVALAALDVLWGFHLPQLANPSDMIELHKGLKEQKVEVAIIDPLYLSLLAGQSEKQASNLFDMGPLLMAATQACLSAGTTPIFIHHTRKNLTHPYEPLELEDLAFAGIQEFARQWLLVSRREPYDPETPGSHRLWMVAGGSVGFGSCWAVDVEEGSIIEDESGLIVGGRRWEATVISASEARQEKAEKGDIKKQEKQARQDKSDDGAILAALDRLTSMVKSPPRKGRKKSSAATDLPAITHKQVITHSKLSHARGERAIGRLLEEEIIEEAKVIVFTGKNNKVKQEKDGIRRKRANSTDATDATD